MSPRRFDSVMDIVISATYLFGGGVIAVALIVIMVRHSSYPFVFLFAATAMSGMALCGVWMLRTAILAHPSDGGEEREADNGSRRRKARPVQPGRRPRRSQGPKSGLAGGPA